MRLLGRIIAIVLASALVIGGTVAFVAAGGTSLLAAGAPGGLEGGAGQGKGQGLEGGGDRGGVPPGGVAPGVVPGTSLAPGASFVPGQRPEGGRGRGEHGAGAGGNANELVSATWRMALIAAAVILVNVLWRAVSRRIRARQGPTRTVGSGATG